MKGLDDLISGPQPEQPNAGPAEPTDKLEPTPGVDANELDLLAVGRAVGMETLERVKKNSFRLQHLMDWAKQQGVNDQLGLVAEIKHLMHRLGSPSIHDLYVYTRLDMERMAAEGKMKKMEVPHGQR